SKIMSYSSDEHSSEDEEEEEEEAKRSILFIKCDSFDCQVWVKRKYPELEGRDGPLVVINPDDGIILGVNYYAKRYGIAQKPGPEALEEAKLLCPELVVITAGEKFGLLDTDVPEEESFKILRVLRDFRKSLAEKDEMIIEVTSKDEFFIDISGLVTRLIFDPIRKHLGEGRMVRGCALPSQDTIDVLTKSRKTFPDKRYSRNPRVIMQGRLGVLTKKRLNSRMRDHVLKSSSIEKYYEEIRLGHSAVVAHLLQEMIDQVTGYDVSIGVGEKTGYELATLQDVQDVGLTQLTELFRRIPVQDPETLALDLINKSHLKDAETVEKSYFNVLTQKGLLTGKHVVHSREEFQEKVRYWSRAFADKLFYRFDCHKRLVTQISVKTEFKGSGSPKILETTAKVEELQNEDDISALVLNHIDTNRLDFKDIAVITLEGFEFVKRHGSPLNQSLVFLIRSFMVSIVTSEIGMGKYPNQFYQNEWELTPRAWHPKPRSFTQEEKLDLLGLLVSPRSNKLGDYREKGTMSGSGEDETDHRSTNPPVERPAPVPGPDSWNFVSVLICI
ncbi:unnamed protein product, partial [Allacma fusca]